MASKPDYLDADEEVIRETAVGFKTMQNGGALVVTSKAVRFQFLYKKPNLKSSRVEGSLLTIPYSDIGEVTAKKKLLIFNVLVIMAREGEEYPFWSGIMNPADFEREIRARITA